MSGNFRYLLDMTLAESPNDDYDDHDDDDDDDDDTF